MIVIKARNVHAALRQAVLEVLPHCQPRGTRNGRALVAPCPVTTVYERPTERVVWWPARDANPYFHVMESLWMLAGRNDLAFVEHYVKRMREYSDDGRTLRGAYGHRWRRWFDYDQLEVIIAALRETPSCRRQVLQMWDARADHGSGWKDVPCNLVAHFRIDIGGALDMTVFCRSNDALWGAYGANAVHFSFLQEYVALALGRQVGRYWQVSDDFHFYDNEQLAAVRAEIEHGADWWSPWRDAPAPPLFEHQAQFDQELPRALELDTTVRTPFLRDVAVPMGLAYRGWRNGDQKSAAYFVATMADCDWKEAATQWLQRRKK